jgi:DNA-directed RNA polymerase sigma subunit (sigma70/sigma32)
MPRERLAVGDHVLRFEARRLGEGPIIVEELSTELGASHERVRQTEVRTFEKI